MRAHARRFGFRPNGETGYSEPSLDEMMRLSLEFGLLRVAERGLNGFILQVHEERLDLEPSEARLFLKGLLLGYFFNYTRDDLTLAEWHQ